MKKSSKFKCFGICTIVTGVVLLSLGIAMPFIFESVTKKVVKSQTALSVENENKWRYIPGIYDVAIVRNIHMYDCLNKDDVIYKGARPKILEVGPFYYREYHDYNDLNFTKLPLIGEETKMMDSVRLNFNLTMKEYGENSPLLDVPIYQIS